jgi:MFS family permease
MKALPKPLFNRNFQLLLACNVISLMGSAIAVVAVPFAVLAVGGSAGDVGYVAAAALIAFVGCLLLGGVMADRMPRNKVMIGANVLQAAAQAASAAVVLSGRGTVWELLGLAAIRGAGLGFYFPAEAGILPQTVPEDQRAEANAIDRTARNGGQIAGAGLGGVVVAALGPGWGLALDAASFAIAALLRVGMRVTSTRPSQTANFAREFRAGWHEFTSRRWLWTVVIQFACINALTGATIAVIGPVVANVNLGGARNWGFVLAAYSTGSVIGAITMIRLHPSRIILAATLAVPGASFLLFALAFPLAVPLLAVAALVAGACLGVFDVNWTTALQQEIPLAALSRVSAYDTLGSAALIPISSAVAGPLADHFGPSLVLTVGGIIIVMLTAAVLAFPEVRQLRRQGSAGPHGNFLARSDDPSAVHGRQDPIPNEDL